MEFEKGFEGYRKDRLLKECPVCSDLFHGYREGYICRQKEIDRLQNIINRYRKFFKLIDFFSFK